ncbi:hypothetical protein [Methylobacterium sp. J-068]|uniref:hypothetical protein n=1 Tax=Methylobacterium sp. J-068 TaxID=2836649 RepID=UPI001FB9916D|nr:hypothetical protein [Methylobacterium sp. J-068]MCJ2034939.1 hypothetical protein [Methylobacterium sp. J-068]
MILDDDLVLVPPLGQLLPPTWPVEKLATLRHSGGEKEFLAEKLPPPEREDQILVDVKMREDVPGASPEIPAIDDPRPIRIVLEQIYVHERLDTVYDLGALHEIR